MIGPPDLGSIDQRDREAPLREGQRQGRAVEPAARDDDILFHGPDYGAAGGIVHALPRRYRRPGGRTGRDRDG